MCLVVACWDGQCLQFLCQEACDLCLGVWPRSSVSVAEGAYKVTLSDWTLFYTALLWSLHDNACVAGIRVFEKLDFMIQEENTCWPSSRVAKVRSRISKLSDIMFIYIYIIHPRFGPSDPLKRYERFKQHYSKEHFCKVLSDETKIPKFDIPVFHAPFTVPPAAPPNLTLRGFSSTRGVNVNWLSWMKRIVSFVRNFYQSSRSMKCWYKGWYRWMRWHQEEGWVHFGLFEPDNYWHIFNFLCLEQAKSSIISRNLMFNAVWLFQVALKSSWKRVLPWWWNVSPWWIATSGGRDVSLVWAFRYVWNDGARGMYETMKRNLNPNETSISQYFVYV